MWGRGVSIDCQRDLAQAFSSSELPSCAILSMYHHTANGHERLREWQRLYEAGVLAPSWHIRTIFVAGDEVTLPYTFLEFSYTFLDRERGYVRCSVRCVVHDVRWFLLEQQSHQMARSSSAD